MLLCIQTGKTLADADRFRFEGTGYFIKPAADMYRLDTSDLWQEGCRNSQLLIADRVDATGMFEFRNLMPRFPIPDGFESEDELFRAEVWKGMDRRYPDGYDERTAQAGRVRDPDDLPDGLPRLLPGGRGLHHVGEEQRHRGGPRPRLRGGLHRRLRDGHHRPRPAGARPDLRALPQPRTRVHARHRHRLRRAWPGRRDQVRNSEMGLGPGGADRHLRHDQGQGGDQGLPAGCSVSRTRWATGSRRRTRPPCWARTCRCPGCSTRRIPGTRRPPRSARSTRPRPMSSRLSTRRAGSRG